MSIQTPKDFLRTMSVLDDLCSHPLAETTDEIATLERDLANSPYVAKMIENRYHAVPKDDSGLVALEGVVFADVVKDDVSRWSQICGSCQSKHPALEVYQSQLGSGVCGVVGCQSPDGQHTRHINLDYGYTDSTMPDVEAHSDIVTSTIRQLMNFDGKSIGIAIERFFCDQAEYLEDSRWLVDGEYFDGEKLNNKLVEHLNSSDGKSLVYTVNVLLSDWLNSRLLYLGDSLYLRFLFKQSEAVTAQS